MQQLNLITSSNKTIMYDQYCKMLIGHPYILARIISCFVEEAKHLSLDEIKKLIKGVRIGDKIVNPHFHLMDKEAFIKDEGLMCYDIYFYIDLPQLDQSTKRVYINIEIQNKASPRYHLVTRSIAYSSRMISSQWGREYDSENYDGMKKVYSFWIMPQATKSKDGCINQLKIAENHLSGNYEEKIYSLGETVTGQTQAMSQAVQKTLENNGGVGIMTGSYDQNLSILSVDNLLLHSTGYTFDTFMEQTKGSLRNFFYDEEDILERDRFLQLHGTGEAQILTADGTVNNVRLCKEDATDEAGRQIWVMSVQVNWDHVNLALLNEAIYSGFWYFDCDENSEIVNANWSHEFRKMLGYHDTLDFPNKLESWSDLLHPQDKERVMVQLQAAIKDKTNQIKYQVEYRMRMKDNQYQWFRASAEVIRRLDGSASRIAGIFINIDAEKKEIMQAQKSAAFHRAFTKADLCEYYVNLEANTFDTFKVEPSLMTVFEQSHTWDELIRHFVDSYVVETDKKAVSSFYDRGYIAERLKGLETELALECRITLNGEERWVRNVVIRGEIEDSEYAMIFLRDITEAKVESARHLQMAADNASMEQLIQSIVRLVDRFVVCDLENDRYEFYNLNGQMIYKPLGFYHDFQMQVLEKYKTLEPLEAIDILIAPDNIRKKLKSENDIYKFEYCSLDEKTYKIASYIPLEWKNGKLEKVLLASMDVTQEKKAEIESRQALKEAYRSAENANRAKTEFLSNMSHVLLCLDWLYLIDAAEVDKKGRINLCI